MSHERSGDGLARYGWTGVVDRASAAAASSSRRPEKFFAICFESGRRRSFTSNRGSRGSAFASIDTAVVSDRLDRTENVACTGLSEPLLVGTDDCYADILEFLGRLHRGLTSETAIPGCLIVNDMAAGAEPEANKRYCDLLEEGLERALTRAGDDDGERRAGRAGLLASSVLGVNLVSKTTGGDSAEISRLVDSMIDEVRRWQRG